MNLKLTFEQLSALHRLFVDEVIHEKPKEIEEKLIQLHMLNIYKKLRNKIEARFAGKGYGISLTEAEALAYYAYFHNRNFLTAYQYEQNFIKTHIAVIDKAYA
jgi:hypothetical protein